MKPVSDRQEWEDVLGFWFPEGRSLDVDARTHRACWRWRMQGGADDEIVSRFSDLTRRAAQGAFDHWALEAEGRLALIIVLDQFSRSIWRGRAQAYMQDPHALSLAMEGFSNGHYSSLETLLFKVVHGLPLGHCEGPDHVQRMDFLIGVRKGIAEKAPATLRPIYESLVKQAQDVRKVITSFGRHPHRNGILGRRSTAAEKIYLAAGEFPHLAAFSAGCG